MPERPFSQRGTRMVVAHRGASAVEAENTIASFELAIAAGADAIEFDVRLTADGHPVVLHDPDVARTTNGHGLVRDMTLAAVKQLRIETSDGDAAEVPTLQEALACCLGRVAVDVELKNIPGEPDFEPDEQSVAEATVEALQGFDGPVLLSSFNPWAIARVRERAPEVPTGLLTEYDVEATAALAFARTGGHPWILPFVRQIRSAPEGFAAEAHADGISIGTWITDDPAEAVALFEKGIDAVATNDPAAVVPSVRGAP